MDEDAFNMSLRKFLKKVGVTAQREIEQTVRNGIADGTLTDGEPLKATATITIPGTQLKLVIDGDLDTK